MAFVLHTKPGTQFAVIAPGGFRILAALEETARLCETDLTITCGTEGHPADDPHTRGEAYDVRVADLTPERLLAVVKALQIALEPLSFYFQYEVPTLPVDVRLRAIAVVNSSASAPHIHLQVKKGHTYPPTVNA